MNGNTGKNALLRFIPNERVREISRTEWEQGARLFGGITLDAPYISGPLGVGPVDGEVIPPAGIDRLYAIPPGCELEIGINTDSAAEPEPKYVPEDKRPKKQQRANKRLYSKARAYYGKTYIVTRAQMILGLLIAVGLILTLSASTALVMLHALGLGKYL